MNYSYFPPAAERTSGLKFCQAKIRKYFNTAILFIKNSPKKSLHAYKLRKTSDLFDR